MILVTGGFGFIGSNLIIALNARGIKNIIVVDDLTDGRKMTNLNGCEFSEYYDVDDFFKKFSSWGDIQYIFHEGAISSTREMNGKLIMERNYEFSNKLLGKAFEHKIPFQYASSASVYGNVPKNIASSEDGHISPQTPYAYSKALFDKKVSALLNNEHFAKMGFNLQGLRYFNVYGRNEMHKGDQASPITKFTQQARETGRIKIFEGSDDIYRDFVCVEDVIQAKLEFAFNRMNSGIFNIGVGKACSFRHLAELIASRENAQIEVITFPKEYKEAYQYWTCASLHKLREAGIGTYFRTVKEYFE